MKALILKDYRAYRLFYLLIMVVLILYTYLNIRFGTVDGIIGFLVVLLPAFSGMFLFVGDESLHYYLLALPISRKSFVLSKYITTYLLSSMITLATMLIIYGLGFSYPNAHADLYELLSIRGLLFALMPITLIVSICYPLLFRFGVKIGVKIVMGVFAGLYGLGIVLIERLIKMNIVLHRSGIFYSVMTYLDYYEESHSTRIYYVGLIFLLLMLTVSICLSIHWYQKKNIV